MYRTNELESSEDESSEDEIVSDKVRETYIGSRKPAKIEKPYTDSQTLFKSLRNQFKQGKDINFCGSYILPDDPLVSDRERIKMTADEIWKVTGYRFTYVDI